MRMLEMVMGILLLVGHWIMQIILFSVQMNSALSNQGTMKISMVCVTSNRQNIANPNPPTFLF